MLACNRTGVDIYLRTTTARFGSEAATRFVKTSVVVSANPVSAINSPDTLSSHAPGH